jgi:hypothetical protein
VDSMPPRLLYVVSLFPCWSETFIVRGVMTDFTGAARPSGSKDIGAVAPK